MRRALVSVVAAALGVGAVMFSSNDAHALGPLDLEVGLEGGYATKPNSNLDLNPLGAGLGARAGVQIFGLYGGLKYMHYFGGSVDVPNGLGGGTTSVSETTNLYGIEAGYGFKLALLTIRPQIGVGNATFSSEGQSNSNLYLEPGVTGLISLGLIYVGADVNYLILPGVSNGDGTSSTYGSLTIHGQVGVTF